MINIPKVKGRTKQDSNGESSEVIGYYFKHINRQQAAFGDILKPEDYTHYICISGFADWNMPRAPKLIEVDPDTIEIITE